LVNDVGVDLISLSLKELTHPKYVTYFIKDADEFASHELLEGSFCLVEELVVAP
jgi:hypothetical protein